MIDERDILIEPEDVKIVNGDFAIVDANNQNIKHLCIANPGDFKVFPGVGAGLYNMQNNPINNFQEVLSKIRSELINDGYKNPVITGTQTDIESTELEISAVRKKKPNRKII
jgi:hypothetical protein